MVNSHQWAQSRSLLRLVLLALALTTIAFILLLFSSPRSAFAQTSPTADYRFQNTLKTSVGTAPALTKIGPKSNTFTTATVDGTSHKVLHFPKGNGLKLSPTTGVVSSSTYTIVVLFELDDVSNFRRIVDFKNGTSDNGLYVENGKLRFFPSPSGTGAPIAANTYVQVVLSRDSGGTVVGYVDGVQQFSFTDSSNDAVIDSNTLRFFRDNESDGSTTEHSAGSVARIRLYNSALTPTEVGALDRIEPTVFTVNRTLEGQDTNTLDGKCDADATAGIQCTLRAAIQQANATSGQDTIEFASAVSNSGTIPLSQQLTIANDPTTDPDLTINGPGASTLTVSGNNSTRVFEIATGARATFNGIKIGNGKLTGSPFGAGVYNGGTLTLIKTVVSANIADSAGGGIFNSGGNLTLLNSNVSGNKSLSTLGGGIYNDAGTVTLVNTVVSGNFANNGGGIRNTTGTLTLIDSTVSGNSTNNDGGGINSSSGTVTLVRSTVSGNSSEDDGGGIEFSGTAANMLTLDNSTISGNATGDKGGGIGNGGTLRITNSTVTKNTTSDTSSNTGTGGGIFNYSGANASLRKTIVAGNSALVAAPDVGEASTTSFTSGGNNLIGNASGISGFGTATSDLLGRNPLLGPLANNGGPTTTHSLLKGSPAINAIPKGINGCGAEVDTDQRGVKRPQGKGCDIGAFEKKV